MRTSDATKTEILSSIKKTQDERKEVLKNSFKVRKDYFKPISSQDLLSVFREELEGVGGIFDFFTSEKKLYDAIPTIISESALQQIFVRDTKIGQQLSKRDISFTTDENHLNTLDTAITTCDALVARTGSILISSALPSGRQLIPYGVTHIVIASTSQLYAQLTDAYQMLQIKYADNFPSQISTITGASRTADIEKTLIMGAHGPKTLLVLVYQD